MHSEGNQSWQFIKKLIIIRSINSCRLKVKKQYANANKQMLIKSITVIIRKKGPFSNVFGKYFTYYSRVQSPEFVLLKCVIIGKHCYSKSCMMWDLEITAERTSEPVLKPGGGVTSADVKAGAAASLKMTGSCSCP